MARKRTTPLEDLAGVVSLMPWWAGVLLAVLLYFWLSSVASHPVTVTHSGRITDALFPQLWHAAATVGQFLAPLICLAGAGMSAWHRHERDRLVTNVTRSESADALDGMTWRQFEVLVSEGFRRQGYRVQETGGGGPDGGVDLVLNKDGEKYLVQCKQWRAYKVGVEVVRELYGVMAARGAAGGYVVTSGRFTKDARDWADGRNVHLIDGTLLHTLVKQSARSTHTASSPPPSPYNAPATAEAAPACPVCSSVMERRRAKRGSNAGNAFWGCSRYPSCRGIIQDR